MTERMLIKLREEHTLEDVKKVINSLQISITKEHKSYDEMKQYRETDEILSSLTPQDLASTKE